MPVHLDPWPYLPTLSRVALALAIGLFIGTERERRQKEAGLRTFAFTAVLGALGGLMGNAFALLALGLLGLLIVLLNVETIRKGEGAEITTSAALLVTGYVGVLAGDGHTFMPTAVGVVTAALLAWKEPLAGFSRALTDGEIRSAILLAILAFVIYPLLPLGSVDPWQLVEPRAAWVTVILIAALGFANYVLLKLYGTRGLALAAFLGGLVNSTVTVAEVARRARDADDGLADSAFRGVVLATFAMLLRNAIILAILAPAALVAAVGPLALMMAGAVGAAALGRRHATRAIGQHAPAPHAPGSTPAWVAAERAVLAVSSPFSLTSALRFGAVFLALHIAGTLAQRSLGASGFYAVSAAGGLVSSASAVASAANLAASAALTPHVAATGAVLAVLASAFVTLPLVSRVGRDRRLTRRVTAMLASIVLLGGAGLALQRALPLVPAGVIPGVLRHDATARATD